MTWYAVYLVADGTLVSLTTTPPSGLDPSLAWSAIAQLPDETHVWDPATHTLVTVTARPEGQAGTFHEAMTDEGWRWYYLVGPVAFEAEDPSPIRHAQPSVSNAKSYIAAHGTEAQFQIALQWAVDYRARLIEAITDGGGTPGTNQRVTKLNNLIGLLGQVV